MELSNDEIRRYGRQLTLPEIGKAGQLKLKQARILLVGAGGLGSPQAIYLAAAGVGTIGLIDPDKVELANLHRQIVHFTDDVGTPKVVSAREKLAKINPHVKVIPFEERLNAQNALEILKDFDLVIDGTDNFPARYLINDACIMLKKSFVYGGIHRFEGQVSVFGGEGPCYRCFFQEPPTPGEVPSCAEAGVVGVLPGIIGLLQANEAVKLICGIGEPLRNRLLIFDGLTTRFRDVTIKKDPGCPMCSANRTIEELKEYSLTCPESHMASENGINEITVQELKAALDQGTDDFCLIDVREPWEWEITHIEGAIHKPLSAIEDDFRDIPQDKKLYLYCQMGGRSAMACQFLQDQGYQNLSNVSGGIDAWAAEIER